MEKKEKSWFRRHWILTIIIVLVIGGIIGTIFEGDSSNNLPASSDTNNQEIKQYTDATLYEMFLMFVSRDSTLTDIQKEEQFKQYKNKGIKGEGIIDNIDDVMLSDSIVVSIVNPENQFMRAATIYFDGSKKDSLQQFSVGDEINFEGRIESYSSLMGIVIKEAELK